VCTVRPKPYRIESELGTLETKSHKATGVGRMVYDSGQEWYEATGPREKFRSIRFTELILDYTSDTSVRDAARRLNRMRLQDYGIIPTTLRNTVEREGEAAAKKMQKAAQSAFAQHSFDQTGMQTGCSGLCIEDASHIENETVADHATILRLENVDTEAYESPEKTVNISIDEVGVKAQRPKRPMPEDVEKPKQVRQTVIHVQYGEKQYILNDGTVMGAIRLLIGFLLSNGLAGKQLVFFADGARDLHNAIAIMFGWARYKTILDWYHLAKKCREQLSMGLSGRKIRNEVLDILLPLLWLGNVDSAIEVLSKLTDKQVRNPDIIQKLIDYFDRVRGNIPCYALRKGLGLRNSSNMGEKSNDLVVSNRQKHNGMSWSREGSVGFASVSALIQNDDLNNWVRYRSVRFTPLEKAA